MKARSDFETRVKKLKLLTIFLTTEGLLSALSWLGTLVFELLLLLQSLLGLFLAFLLYLSL